jgi:hypothetical protein
MTALFGNTASLNDDVSSWDVSDVAVIHGFFGYATPFDSEAS